MPEKQSQRFWWQRPIGRIGWHPVEPTLGHWHYPFENLQASPGEVYASIKDAIQRLGIPDASFSEVIYREAGIFSSGRMYLRVNRENHVFDICAAPFGTEFFVSWWLAEARPSAIWPTLAAVFYSGLTYLFFVEKFGGGGFVFAALLFIAGFVLVGAVIGQSSGERWVQYVLVIPLLGWLLERLFLPPTYFRRDTALMFKESVERAVREAVAGMAKAKGVRLPTDEEWKPIMRDLFRR